jgi:hypothetical protein
MENFLEACHPAVQLHQDPPLGDGKTESRLTDIGPFLRMELESENLIVVRKKFCIRDTRQSA